MKSMTCLTWEPDRVNVHRRYRELDLATTPELDQLTLMAMMAERGLS